MIPIPKSAILSRNSADELLLRDKARAWIESEERSPGLHASDFLDPLQKYWQEVDPQPLTDRLVTMFLVGKVLHAFVLGSVSGTVDIGTSDSGSSYSDSLGISFSPDARLVNGQVAELKTSRSFYEPKDLEDLSLYLEQLLVYMVATNTTESSLWVLYLNLRDESGHTAPVFRCFRFAVSEADLGLTRDFLHKAKAELSFALESRDHRSLPLCRPFKCGAANCVWYPKCQPEGRFGDPQWDSTEPKKKGKKK